MYCFDPQYKRDKSLLMSFKFAFSSLFLFLFIIIEIKLNISRMKRTLSHLPPLWRSQARTSCLLSCQEDSDNGPRIVGAPL